MRRAFLLLAALLLAPAPVMSADRAPVREAPVGCGRQIAVEPFPCESVVRAAGDGRLQLYLRRATGRLRVLGRASCDTYQICFHVPIPFREQAPVLLEVTCPQMVDYRFIREEPPNLRVAARLVNADSAVLHWTSWVLVKQNTYPDLPTYVPFPAPGELPDSFRQWLDTTDCCQVSDPLVQFKADSILDTTTNLMKAASDVNVICRRIPWQFPHQPLAFDAVYTLKWGNSCTGHAHAGTALLRACGIPARPLLVIMVGAVQDMHWIVDYYVPSYGWVRMETSLGNNPMEPQNELVVQACTPSDEFPVWFPCAIDAEFHTSDTAYGMWMPDWGGGHEAFQAVTMGDSTERVNYAIALTQWVYNLHSSYWGISLSPADSTAFAAGLGHQSAALALIQSRDLPGYVAEMQQALADYQAVSAAPVETLYSEDFENGQAGWTHGGAPDEWELGVPTYGPANAHSGGNCWGTNLDGPYANNDDCWLASPPIDLSRLASANLGFWVWNSVGDVYGEVYDPVWVEVSRDGATFKPLSSRMGGVNDDPEITAVGGWSHVQLDLVQYLGDTVQVRFHFKSDSQVVFAGSYIDDVHVTGRRPGTGIAETPTAEVRTTNLQTIVRGVLFLQNGDCPASNSMRCSEGLSPFCILLDIAGRKVLDLHPGPNDVRRLSPGVYFVTEYSVVSSQHSGTVNGARNTVHVRKVILQR